MSTFVLARYYFRVFALLAAALVASWIALCLRTDTSWIAPVSESDAALSCGREIVPRQAPSISAYYANLSGDDDLQTQICAFDRVFDGSAEDRAHLVNFSQKILEFPWPGRHDIAQHFYRKVIAANPQDALSLYLRAHKLDSKTYSGRILNNATPEQAHPVESQDSAPAAHEP